MTNEDKIENAMDMIIEHGGHSGEHHKAWCLDQVFRILAGDKYDLWVKSACKGEDGPNTYSWDIGIAP